MELDRKGEYTFFQYNCLSSSFSHGSIFRGAIFWYPQNSSEYHLWYIDLQFYLFIICTASGKIPCQQTWKFNSSICMEVTAHFNLTWIFHCFSVYPLAANPFPTLNVEGMEQVWKCGKRVPWEACLIWNG